MYRSALLFALVCAGCAQPMPNRPGPACTTEDDCPGGTVPSGGGGGGGGGGTATDGGIVVSDGSFGATRVMGQVVVAQVLPLTSEPSASRTEANWSVEDLRSSTRVVSGMGGNFDLPSASITAERTVLLRARPPAGGGTFSGIAEFSAASLRTVSIYAVNTRAFEDALLPTRVAPNAANGHIIIELAGVPSTVSGVSAAPVDATSAQIVYDAPGEMLSSSSRATDQRGTIVLVNVDAPSEGRRLRVDLRRGTSVVRLNIFAIAGGITWVQSSPP